MRTPRVVFRTLSFVVCSTVLALTGAPVWASPVSVTVNTAALSSTPAQLAFDFIDGGPPSNSITISGFATDGTLGSATLTGGASGALPGTVTLTDSAFFNEYLTDFTLGNTFSFQLDATNNAPASISLPDAFSLFVLNPTTGLPLINTTDPTGSGSLLTWNIDESTQGSLSVYAAPGGEAVVTAAPVPLPSSLLLMGSSFLLFVVEAASSKFNRLLKKSPVTAKLR